MELLFGVGVLVVFVIVVLVKTAIVVPQRHEYVVERLGKYRTTLEAGFHILVHILDKIAYRRNLKEELVDIGSQTCITADNVTLEVDGIMYIQVVNSRQSAYGIDNYHVAASQLAQTSLRSAIGKISLDNTFEAREALNQEVVNAIDDAAQNWGIKVLRYEIKDIEPPRTILDAMERQMKAEREKRATILESEGNRQSAINVAEGAKQAQVLAAEADKAEQILQAEGEAQAIIAVADAQAKALDTVGKVANTEEGQKAIQLDLADKAIEAKRAIAKDSTVVLLPDGSTNAANVVAEAMTIINTLNSEKSVHQ